ncbi:helical backbone metal receptor [Dermatobacter hominis]|uniref:helical backbone metal receptor n=1 Tax=Dermatobacter hominis TaxID=2884263 RepID=UPI001D10DA7F|nr:helical backbone metal receptor [Dermatobacter hominis]UDY37565.1 helical backbone metal receptor [Dermatobacter hominis]
MRIVSLVPSATETLRAWGVTPVACTRFCEQPDLPTVGGTKNPDLEEIAGFRPDLVVLDEEENRLEDHDVLVAAGVPVHVLAIRSVDDVAAQLPALADALGVEPGPLAPLPQPRRTELRAFVPIWRRPWMRLGRGTYGASLLERIGVAVVPTAGGRYDPTELDAVHHERPDVVLVPSEPYRFSDRHLDELRDLAPVIRVDGQDLFWWGARTPAAITRLAEQIRGA